MNAEISETIGARLLRFDVQIPELITQRKFVSATCHDHSKILTEMHCSHQYLSIDPTKVCDAHFNAHKPAHKLQKIVNMNVDISETIKDRELRSQI